jgi:hypothetical protein
MMLLKTYGQTPLILSFIVSCALAAVCCRVSTVRAAEAVSANEGAKTQRAILPFFVFDEKGGANNHYIASGWMGNAGGIKVDEACTNNPYAGKTCLRFEYTAADDWGGIAWQDPANDWGDLPGGWNLTGARKLKFWARGEQGGETVSFKFGVLGEDKKYSDSATGALNDLKLTKEWKEYTIDLEGKDLTRIKTGFIWSLTGQRSAVVFFLDYIRFE